MEVNKPAHDDRKITYSLLKNKLKSVAVSDKKINKSYIVACVNVGSTANKKYYNGMAHLLEHMCFITSKKYKTKNYIHNKAQEFGGYSNAYTDDIHTVYYYEIFTKHLEEMMEIFSDFLFNSELKEEHILDELKNVDSEHKKNINNDGFRCFNIEHLLCDEKSEYNGFFTGTIESLNKPDIRKKMLQFYKKYYVPENISICIVSDLEIKKIEQITKKYFENFKNNNKPPKIKLLKPFYTKNMNKTFIINTVNKTFQIKYIFETEKINKYTETKVFNYVSFLLNLDMKNTLYDHLKINNYIKSLVSYFETSTGLFFIIFDLTKKGQDNIHEVDGYLRYYIDYIFNLDYKKLYAINKNIEEHNYNNLTKEDPIELAQMLAINTFTYNYKNIYDGNYLILDYNEKHIKDIKKYINFDKCIQIISTDEFKEKNYLIDAYYGTKYKQINKIIGKPISFKINFDFNNKYITDLSFISNLKHEIPTEVTKNIWFGNTSKFNEKNSYIGICFSDPTFFMSAKNTIFTNISVEILQYLLDRELWNPQSVDYGFGFYSDPMYNEIMLRINVFNNVEQGQEFINYILNFIMKKDISNVAEDFIKQKLKNYTDSVKNTNKISPWYYVNYLLGLNYKNNYSTEELLDELKKIKISDFIIYFNNFLKKSNCMILNYGNIKKQFNFDLLKNNLNSKFKFSEFSLTKSIKIKHPNKTEKDSCIKVIINLGKLDDILSLHLMLAVLIMKELFYNKLRTDKQLGYLVSASWFKIYDNYYINQQIQSKYDYKILIDNITEFNKNFANYLKNINIQTWINTLKEHFKTKDISIDESFLKYYAEISKKEFRYKRDEELLTKIKYITDKSFKDFVNKYIVNNKNIYTIFVEKN